MVSRSTCSSKAASSFTIRGVPTGGAQSVRSALAAELVFTGGMINAKRAERLGLFNRVVAPDDLEQTVSGLAGQIAGGPAEVIASAKRTLRRSLAADLDEILEMEAEAQLRAFQSPAFGEGVQAFLDRRAPRFGK